MPSQCEEIRKEYERLKALKQEFDLALKEAIETGDLAKAKELRAILEKKRDELRDKLWPFEHLPQKELKRQYESQREIFTRLHVLEQLSTGETGIIAIDGKEYPFPTYEELTQRIRKNKEFLKPKLEQGFSRLLIVPFGLKLDDLIQKYKAVILKHHKEGKLLATKKNPTDPDEQLALDESAPLWSWEGYEDADTLGKLVYFPKRFTEQNHQGQTKEEILKAERAGFQILFIEDLPNIPREGKGQETGKDKNKRKQLEAGKTPEEYLQTLETAPLYQGEQGMTPEAQLVYSIIHLEETNQVIDDYQGKGSVSYQLGAWFPITGGVPYACWVRDYRRAILGGRNPRGRNGGCGCRSSVRV